jgi:hypothetical protein
VIFLSPLILIFFDFASPPSLVLVHLMVIL